MSHRLSTIGYEGRDLPTFLECLASHGVECVLDIRENPFSRKPGFSKGPLSQALTAAGIRYVHMKDLGTPRALREKVKSDEDYEAFFLEMRRHLSTRQEAIEQACDCVCRMDCCLLCYEASADACHRKLVAEMIRERCAQRLEILHL